MAPKPTAVVRGASLLILLQIGSRAITFIGNQLLLRFLTAELLGVSTQLEVFYLSILFFSRESLRVAVQRTDATITDTETTPPPSSSPKSPKSPTSPPPKAHKQTTQTNPKEKHATTTTSHPLPPSVDIRTTQSAINLSYLPLFIGTPLTFLLAHLYLTSLPSNFLTNTPYLFQSVAIYAISALVELAAEPAFAVLAIRLHFTTRARAESLATLARCLLTLGTAAWGVRIGQDLGVLPFAVGQAGYAGVVFVVYLIGALGLASRHGFSLLPSRLGEEEQGGYLMGLFSKRTLRLVRGLVVQSWVKYVLTQGDTLLVSVLSSTEAVGVYALVSNYGGLLARLVFQPVEESSRSYFSRLLAGLREEKEVSKTGLGQSKVEEKGRVLMKGLEDSSDNDGNDDKAADGEMHHSSQPKDDPIETARTSLLTLLHIYLLLALPILSLGPTAAGPFLRLVTSNASNANNATGWNTAPPALSLYCFYIPLLAINGAAEAFVSSVASESDVLGQSAFMALFTILFAAAGYIGLVVMGLGARGIVAANAVNMMCRIMWSGWFITRWFAARTDGKGKGRGKGKGKGEAGGSGLGLGIRHAMPKQLATASAVVTAGVVRTLVVEGEDALVSLVKVAACAVPFGLVL